MGALAAAGPTPLVRLRKLMPGADFALYAKLEVAHAGGCIRQRTALAAVLDAIRSGRVRRGTVVIEASSGRFAIELAEVCAFYDLRLICVIDTHAAAENVAILRASGAEIDLVREVDPTSGDCSAARLARIAVLMARHAGSFWPDQHAEPEGSLAPRRTMREILHTLDEPADYLFCPVSAWATLRGCSEQAHAQGLRTQVVAVDTVSSLVFGRPRGGHLVDGPLLPELARVVHVTDRDCVVGCRTLVEREGIRAGGASGAVVMAVHGMRNLVRRGATCVVVLPDGDEECLETIYADAWVRHQFGEIPDLLVDEPAGLAVPA